MIDKKQLAEIIKALNEAYKSAGKEMKFVVIDDGETSEILIDKRKKKDIN